MPTETDARLDDVIEEAREALLARQTEDGHWVYELEADATIPAEYILLDHFLDELDPDTLDIHQRLARYLREIQGEDGGWPLFHAGDTDISATVKAYYALKLTGDLPDAPHMERARDAVLGLGGAARCNVFTRIMLALFGQVPWRAVPVMLVQIILLPRWFPFHLSKVSYWTRTVLTPLLVLMAEKPQARNPKGVKIDELFTTPPFQERRYMVNSTGALLGHMFLWLDRGMRLALTVFPNLWQRRATDRAVKFVTERLDGEEGLGGIFPAMANAVMMFDTLGYEKDHPHFVQARNAVKNLVVIDGDRAYCQPCVSPVWDTALALHALLETNHEEDAAAVKRATKWLRDHQILDIKGDWHDQRPGLRPGAWAFQYRNEYYPDTDDSSVVAMALDRADSDENRESVDRGVEWIIGMQCRNGGWGSFDADNTLYYLNHIPFADHGALLDPPTEDVSARCISLLAQRGHSADHPAMATGIDYLKRTQMDDGSWYGRWGTNYIYGTWSVLCALNAVGEDPQAPYIRRAVGWLKSRQLEDGGWGEDCASYWPGREREVKGSAASQTAWAMLGLMAMGEAQSDAVRRGVEYLLDAPKNGSGWEEKFYNAVGFPRVFFLKYHGYSTYFPLWALARYRALTKGGLNHTPHGM
ncbi:MAG: squalene--hopene cyclase [Pseudomonadota bacterium]|nr:squalene--hopene cyclase [Pseudomonadota bacterium]